ncbi:MAG: DUF4173 domain-containing protein [Lachnospiraceae bacterium]|nr:DUF4173 domain-containing protein [Lachnospiraceae bacterium]
MNDNIPETLISETPISETPISEAHMSEEPVSEAPMPETPMPEAHMTEAPMPEIPMPEAHMTEAHIPETPIPTPRKVPFVKKLTENEIKIKENVLPIALASLIYSFFKVFCIYKNFNGITAPLNVAAAILYYGFVIKKLELKMEKDVIFNAVVALLLGVHLTMTVDPLLTVCDCFGIVLILIFGLLHIFLDDTGWRFSHYISEALSTFAEALGNSLILQPVAETVRKLREKKGERKKFHIDKKYRDVLIGIGIACACLTIILPLLGSADSKFSGLLDNVLSAVGDMFEGLGKLFDKLFGLKHIDFAFYVIFFTLFSYGIVRSLCARVVKPVTEKAKNDNTVIVVTVNAIIGFVYLLFSGFQIYYLFLGKFVDSADFNYAEYAREGFFQLLFVSIINVLLVYAFVSMFEVTTGVRISLLVICACTYIMIASSVFRLYMYVSAYKLSYDRLSALFMLLLITLEMCGLVRYIFDSSFSLLKYRIAFVTIAYILYIYANPSGMVAAWNLSADNCRNECGDKYYSNVDFYYISNHLSADAAPAIARAIEREDDPEFTGRFADYFWTNESEDDLRVEYRVKHGYSINHMDVRTFNFAEYRKLKLYEKIADELSIWAD